MTKRDELMAAATPRTLRPQEEVKNALVGRRRGRNWLHQLLSLRSEDKHRLDKLLDRVIRQGVLTNKSKIFRAALFALEEHPDAVSLIKRLS